MAGLRLYTSNRLEILVEELAALVGSPLADPFKSEFVVVQSKGMERWISMELARIHGVCANIRFPFPDHFVGLVFKAFFPDTSDGAAFDPAVMTWRIMRVLPSLVEKRVFRELRHYLSGDDTGVKLFQLSEKIAAVFDQYIVFRPEMVLGWQQGREDHWQAVLWRELVRGHETSHDAALRRSFLESVKKSDARPEGLPERVAVFGISHLPPYHVQIFSAVSKLIDVHLFLLNPCREYWGDIVSGREMRRISERSGKAGKMPEDLYLYGGNSLLASMGALGRDFIDMIYGLGCDERDFFLDPQDGTLLSSIQSDILNLRDRGRSGNEKGLIREDDLSIRIHSCHSPMREIEVLQDSLLAMFDADRTLRPVDVLVMAPDIGSYAPFIEAVFTLAVDDPRWIPFSIADRGVRRQSPVIQAFLDLLALYGGRFGALQVLSVLETRAVRDKFSINEEDFEIIQNWVRETGIRWGIDAESRKTLGLPEFPENTWRSGFERLLLGYALPGRGDNIYEGIAPYDALEGSETAVFNRFLAFADRLFKFVSGLGEPRTPDRWAVLLSEILDYFFLSDEETQRDMQVIRRALNGLAEVRSLAGFDGKIGIDVIRPYLEGRLEGDDYGAGFLSGGLTFCSILPMRSIPFRVICLIGMNDGDYPRETRSMGFDLISREPIPGDRSRRNDDRYLFLEAVLSAREKLHISYLGQSHQDNSVRPPSVLVSELLDYIEQGFETPAGEVRELVLVRHRLQAFSPDYFRSRGKLFSYSEENLEAAKRAVDPEKSPARFISGYLTNPPEERKTVDLNELCRFFSNPARFLLNSRLGIFLGEDTAALDENEPFEVTGLEKYRMEQYMVEKFLAGFDAEDIFRVLKAEGRLPHGAPGRLLYRELSEDVRAFVQQVLHCRPQGTPEAVDVDLQINGFRITGRIENVYSGCLFHYRFADITAADRLRAWIYHAVHNLIRSGRSLCGCKLIGRDLCYNYPPVGESPKILSTLLEVFRQGLTRPVPFFPESSWIYAQALWKGKKREDAVAAAVRNWMGNDFRRGEGDDPYCRICFKQMDPVKDIFLGEFRRIAEDIFMPVLECEEKTKA